MIYNVINVSVIIINYDIDDIMQNTDIQHNQLLSGKLQLCILISVINR